MLGQLSGCGIFKELILNLPKKKNEIQPKDLTVYVRKHIEPLDISTISSSLKDGSEYQLGLINTQKTLIALIEKKYFHGATDAELEAWLSVKMFREKTITRYLENLHKCEPFLFEIIKERLAKVKDWRDITPKKKELPKEEPEPTPEEIKATTELTPEGYCAICDTDYGTLLNQHNLLNHSNDNEENRREKEDEKV